MFASYQNQTAAPLTLKFDNARGFYIAITGNNVPDRVPDLFINRKYKNNKAMFTCDTLDLRKMNAKLIDSVTEISILSDRAVTSMIADIREHIGLLYDICECIAMLEMLTTFAQVSSKHNYVRRRCGDTIAIRNGRHPIYNAEDFVPNDAYATEAARFQIVTGINMSGKCSLKY